MAMTLATLICWKPNLIGKELLQSRQSRSTKISKTIETAISKPIVFGVKLGKHYYLMKSMKESFPH